VVIAACAHKIFIGYVTVRLDSAEDNLRLSAAAITGGGLRRKKSIGHVTDRAAGRVQVAV